MRVSVLCSRRAPGLETLLERGRGPDATYRVVSCLTTDPDCAGASLLDARGVPLRRLDLRRFCEERGAPVSDRDLRAEHDRRILGALAPDRPEALLLCGYLYVVTDVLLDAFPERVLNLHHSDLTVLDDEGRPRYRGLRAVGDAIRAGESETRSSAHLATPEVDEGPLVALTRAFPVHPLVGDARRRGREDVLKAYAYAHREWMMEESWGGLADRALGILARRLRSPFAVEDASATDPGAGRERPAGRAP